MRTTSILVVIMFMTINSCAQTGKLTKQIAKKVIEKNFKKDCEQRLNTETFSIRKGYNELVAELRQLENKGYVSISSNTISDIQGSYKKVSAKLTDKAKTEFSGRSKSTMYGKTRYYKVATAEILDIKGISTSNDGNSALVRFIYRLKPTALYPIRRKKGSSSDCSTRILQADVKLIKFDTGWQIEQPKYGW